MSKYLSWGFLVILFCVVFGCGKPEERLLIMAHRGASASAPENTKIAIEKAVEYGADYSEIDVHLTCDGEIILLHDETLERTTDGEGNVWDFSLEDIGHLDAGVWFGEEFKGEPIPTLEEILRFAAGHIKLNIEIKISREEPEIVTKVVDKIHDHDFINDCIVTSFDRKTVERVKKIDPRIRTGFIFARNYPEDVFMGNWEVLSCNYSVVDDEFVQKARENNKKIFVWTVNKKDEMLRLIDLKVDSIITNKPELLMEVLKELGMR